MNARLSKALTWRREHPIQQFGQSGDVSTFGGSTGCTHTGLQFLAALWGRGTYTHDQVSRRARYPAPSANPTRRGLRPSEVATFCRSVGLPYATRNGLTAAQVVAAARLGPVGFGHAYSWWPEWMGRTYQGITADGKPNGFAKPLRHAGKTQLSGFTGAHWGTLLGVDGTTVYAWEPNHGSPARPERPPYDELTLAQFSAVYESYRAVLGRDLYALVPLRGLPL